MILNKIDVMVLCKVLVFKNQEKSINQISKELELSPSQAFRSIMKLREYDLLYAETLKPNPSEVLNFLKYAVRYICPAKMTERAKGVPTGYSFPGFKKRFHSKEPLVWDVGGSRYNKVCSGRGVQPIEKRIVEASLVDKALYEVASLVDMLRVGKNREKEFAYDRLQQSLLENHGI
jgi:DNA-binding Lrp family transcriptional regulator